MPSRSAPSTSSSRERAVRLGVESTSSPPGASDAASAATKAGLSATCSSTSMAVTRSNRPRPSAARSPLAIGDRKPAPRSMGLRRRHVLRRRIDPGHRRAEPASGSHSSPAPQPTSSARLPAERPERARIAVPMRVDCLAHEPQPHRIEPVQHRRGALRDPTSPPPARRNARPLRRGSWLARARLHWPWRTP